MFLKSSTGDSWREIEDEWDFPRLERWLQYCQRHPPLQVMVSSYLGINREEPMRVTEKNFPEFLTMLSMSKGAGASR